MYNEMKNTEFDVAVVGAGPAGLSAAIHSARKGAKVLVLEQNDKPLKKLYATGNGRCNFTNMNMDGDVYRGSDISLIYNIIERFDRDRLLSFFEDIGMRYKDIGGYVYPYNEQARTVAQALLLEARRLGIVIKCGEKVTGILRSDQEIKNSEVRSADRVSGNLHNSELNTKHKYNSALNKKYRFKIITDSQQYECKSLVIAVGGKASPTHGSDGNLNDIIKSLGHTVKKQKPALVPLLFRDKSISKLQGVRVKCAVSLTADGERLTGEQGEIIFNKDNISGIPVMQMSRFATCIDGKIKKIELHIDLFPDESEDELRERLHHFFGLEDRSAYEALSLCLNEKLTDICLCKAGILANKSSKEAGKDRLGKLAHILKDFTVEITGNAGFERAQVTAGGVPLSELNENLESRYVQGLYIVGELCDADGTCGGYNLQWAFSSGAVAGSSASHT